ncbi:MAG: hypothetical protein DME09_09110 [Candidatus Rokuibacteriota bacterium]|nr:MAG: hypothetical protein DME09_09110 [Candidatus Rokubacteria bacterium]
MPVPLQTGIWISGSDGDRYDDSHPGAVDIQRRTGRAPPRLTVDDGRRSRKDGSMKNVQLTVEGNILIIKVDLSKEFGPSSSGKTIIVASTEGNVAVPEREEKVGVNVYRKK